MQIFAVAVNQVERGAQTGLWINAMRQERNKPQSIHPQRQSR